MLNKVQTAVDSQTKHYVNKEERYQKEKDEQWVYIDGKLSNAAAKREDLRKGSHSLEATPGGGLEKPKTSYVIKDGVYKPKDVGKTGMAFFIDNRKPVGLIDVNDQHIKSLDEIPATTQPKVVDVFEDQKSSLAEEVHKPSLAKVRDPSIE